MQRAFFSILLENVVSFLGQIALRPAKAVTKDLGGAISKAIASKLLLALGSAALGLNVSGTPFLRFSSDKTPSLKDGSLEWVKP